jgi:hypothetical protein
VRVHVFVRNRRRQRTIIIAGAVGRRFLRRSVAGSGTSPRLVTLFIICREHCLARDRSTGEGNRVLVQPLSPHLQIGGLPLFLCCRRGHLSTARAKGLAPELISEGARGMREGHIWMPKPGVPKRDGWTR